MISFSDRPADPNDYLPKPISPYLAKDLDQLLTFVASTGPVERALIAECHRCRNHLLYLMYPGSITGGNDHLAYMIAARLRALTINHESHSASLHSDDHEPHFGPA